MYQVTHFLPTIIGLVSAVPTTWPLLLIAVPPAPSPPRVGSTVGLLLVHTAARVVAEIAVAEGLPVVTQAVSRARVMLSVVTDMVPERAQPVTAVPGAPTS